MKQIKAWLQKQRTYTLHKLIRQKFQRRQTRVGGIDIQWQADLADLQMLMKDNDQYRYLLCVIDVLCCWCVLQICLGDTDFQQDRKNTHQCISNYSEKWTIAEITANR
jgi:hypothetical protein